MGMGTVDGVGELTVNIEKKKRNVAASSGTVSDKKT
jgi:hypothetical protein